MAIQSYGNPIWELERRINTVNNQILDVRQRSSTAFAALDTRESTVEKKVQRIEDFLSADITRFRNLRVSALAAITGTIGGWTITSADIRNSAGTVKLRGAGNLAFGATPPTAANVGTGVFIDNTGIYGLNANTQQFYIKSTDGKGYFAAGNVVLDTAGVTVSGTSALNITKSVTDPGSDIVSINATTTLESSASDQNIFAKGFSYTFTKTGPKDLQNVAALYADIAVTGSGSISSRATAVYSKFSSSTQDIAGAIGVYNEGAFDSPAAVGEYYGFWAAGVTGTGAATIVGGLRVDPSSMNTIATQYGVWITSSVGTGTNRKGIAIEWPTTASAAYYSIYSSSLAQSVHAGNFRIGSTTAPTVALDVTGAALISTTLGVTGHVTFEGVTSTGATGTGKLVFDGTPTLVTPVLGVATATSINKITLTQPASGATLTLIDGKTFTVNKTMSFTAADDTGVYTLPTGTKTLVATDVTTLSSLVSVGTITTGTWNASIVGLAYGGTAKNLTASAGGIVWTDSDSMEVLAGTATAGLALVSGASATPSWYAPTAGRVIFAGTNGVLSDDAGLTYNSTTDKLTVTGGILDSALTNGRVVYASTSGLLADSPTLLFDVGTSTFTADYIKSPSLTSGRVVFTTTNGQLTDDADLTFSGATLTATNVESSGTITKTLTSGGTIVLGSPGNTPGLIGITNDANTYRGDIRRAADGWYIGTHAATTLPVPLVKILDVGELLVDTRLVSTPPAAQTLTGNGQTITLPTTGFTKEVTTAAARTGTIITAGSYDGQILVLFHSGSAANTITMAAAGTSNVANGVTCVLRGLEASMFIWDSGASRWFPVFR